MGDRELYYKLKSYYEFLGVDENVDEKKLKHVYKVLAKKYHPDANIDDTEATKRFQKLGEAYKELLDEKNRNLYKRLKEKYQFERESNKDNKEENQEKKERKKRYIFNRRDGSKIELQPLERIIIFDESIYLYRICQYFKDFTLINDIYGRINLQELMRNPEYCDFCINNLLSKSNINKYIKTYNCFFGHIEGARKNGKNFYRSCNLEDFDNFDIGLELGSIRLKRNCGINVNEELYLEKVGSGYIKGKPISQYLIYSDSENILDIVYSDDIDFERIKRDGIYKGALTNKLLEYNRIREKVKNDNGYMGGLEFDPIYEDYDVVIDEEIREWFRSKDKNKSKE